MNTQQINNHIANKIIQIIEKGVNPWVKGWKHPNQTNTKIYSNKYAYNYVTGKIYSGINQIMLEPGYYMTFNQIKEMGAHLKKGSISNIVVFTKTSRVKADDEKVKEILQNLKNKEDTIYIDDKFITWQKIKNDWYAIKTMLKDYRVFSINDIENLKPIKNRPILDKQEIIINNPKTFEDNIEAEKIINDYILRSKVNLKNQLQDSAYYSPSKHQVVIPLKSQFMNMGEYYGTLFHELAHSTGHKTLLNREGIEGVSPFGSTTYSKEELIAEMTSTFITSFLNINTDDLFTNSASYLKGWAENLRTTLKNSIMSALTKAQKAFELILNINN